MMYTELSEDRVLVLTTSGMPSPFMSSASTLGSTWVWDQGKLPVTLGSVLLELEVLKAPV